MKNFDAVRGSFAVLESIECEIYQLQDDYMKLCRSLTDGHSAETIEWFESEDFADSLKIEEYHAHIKSALQSIYEARMTLLSSRIGQSVLVDKEVELYEDDTCGYYASDEYKKHYRRNNFPTIAVEREDQWADCDEDRYYTQEVVCYDVSASSLKEWDDEKIFSYLKENCVGKCNTLSGTDEYFIPCITFGKLKVSAQVNYRMWDYRDDRHFTQEEHASMITAEEFEECITKDTWIDVAVYYDGRELMMGQADIYEISRFLHELARGYVEIREYQL